MRSFQKMLLGSFLSLFALTSYAIQVDVQTGKSAEDVKALGFSVNGKSYGGRCCTYSKTEMPEGVYTFGVRVGGLIRGTDVSCFTSSGKNSVTLNTDSTAVLSYDNTKKTCTMNIVTIVRKK